MVDISCGLELGHLSGECMCDQCTEIFRVCLGFCIGHQYWSAALSYCMQQSHDGDACGWHGIFSACVVAAFASTARGADRGAHRGQGHRRSHCLVLRGHRCAACTRWPGAWPIRPLCSKRRGNGCAVRAHAVAVVFACRAAIKDVVSTKILGAHKQRHRTCKPY